jgi:hypothetical protein
MASTWRYCNATDSDTIPERRSYCAFFIVTVNANEKKTAQATVRFSVLLNQSRLTVTTEFTAIALTAVMRTFTTIITTVVAITAERTIPAFATEITALTFTTRRTTITE